jgi:RNA-dependent RNA polymerase
MTDEKMALHLLQKYIDPNQMTMTVAAMILEGFQGTREPFVTSLLQLWRAWSIKYLKEKAKILIEKERFFLVASMRQQRSGPFR